MTHLLNNALPLLSIGLTRESGYQGQTCFCSTGFADIGVCFWLTAMEDVPPARLQSMQDPHQINVGPDMRRNPILKRPGRSVGSPRLMQH